MPSRITYKTETPQLFLLGNVQFYAVFDYSYGLRNKIATYEYPFIDGVDYSMNGIGEEDISISGKIISFENFGSPHMTQLEQIKAAVMKQEAQDFAHPEVGAFRVIVEQFSMSQVGGSEGYGFELRMKKVTAIREKEVAQERAEQMMLAKNPTGTAKKSHTVVKGESLWKIAKRYYGSGTLWTKLWDANKTVLRSRKPHLIYPGEKITIP